MKKTSKKVSEVAEVVGEVSELKEGSFDTMPAVVDVSARIDALEARVAALEAKRADSPPRQEASSELDFRAVDDDFVEQHSDAAWFDFVIKKDPPKWAGPSQVDKKFSETPIDFMKSYIGFQKWAVKKESAKGDAAKKNDKGEPYWRWNMKQVQIAQYWLERAERLEKGDLPF